MKVKVILFTLEGVDVGILCSKMLIIIGVVAFIVVLLIILSCLSPISSPPKLRLENSHVLITGGSAGIGKAIAKEVLKQGASVTLLARDKVKLQDAKTELEKGLTENSKQKIEIMSIDVSAGFDKIEKCVHQIEEKLGPVDVLVNNAGISCCSTMDETTVEEFKKIMDVNFFGCVNVTKALVKSMKSRNCGRIVFMSSIAGQTGIFGYSAYSSSKFAMCGFAQCLQMELKPYNIYVTVVYPPDTDTPGFESEIDEKPKECCLISQTAGLYEADTVAKKTVSDSMNGKFHCYFGIDGLMMSATTGGLTPTHSLLDVIKQVPLLFFFRLISFFYGHYFDSIVKKCHDERIKEEKLKTS